MRMIIISINSDLNINITQTSHIAVHDICMLQVTQKNSIMNDGCYLTVVSWLRTVESTVESTEHRRNTTCLLTFGSCFSSQIIVIRELISILKITNY